MVDGASRLWTPLRVPRRRPGSPRDPKHSVSPLPPLRHPQDALDTDLHPVSDHVHPTLSLPTPLRPSLVTTIPGGRGWGPLTVSTPDPWVPPRLTGTVCLVEGAHDPYVDSPRPFASTPWPTPRLHGVPERGPRGTSYGENQDLTLRVGFTVIPPVTVGPHTLRRVP